VCHGEHWDIKFMEARAARRKVPNDRINNFHSLPLLLHGWNRIKRDRHDVKLEMNKKFGKKTEI
jgi:hypothetical protein